MNKKEHLEVQKIYEYQNFTVEELNELFGRLGIKDGARLFYLMLKSFGLAARVANAAWGFYQMWKRKDPNLSREEENLAEALHDYSPDNFIVPDGCLEYAAGCFEEFYNEASTLTTKEEIEELIYTWGKKLRDAQAAKTAAAQAAILEKKPKKRKPATSTS